MDKAKQVTWLTEKVPEDFRFIAEKLLPFLPLTHNQVITWLQHNDYDSPVALDLVRQAKKDGIFSND